MSRDNMFWGTILLLVGALFLANNLGYLAFDFRLLWPLFIIALGVYILVGRTWGPSHSESEHVTVPLDGAKEAYLKLEHGAGRLHLEGASGKNDLLSGDFSAMRYTTRKDGGKLTVKMRTAVEDAFFWAFPWNWHRGSREWNFSLNPDLPISMKIESGASDNRLDFSEIKLVDLDLDSGASSTNITLPKKAGHTKAEISGGAASFDITIPKGVAARIRVESGLGSLDIDEDRFPRSGKAYQSENYDSAANTLDLRVEVGVSSVTIR